MANSKKIAVVLNGCGHRDGSEIHEAVLTLLAIEEAGGTWECLGLDLEQASVIDHVTGEVQGNQMRNMLKESARIARGRIKHLDLAKTADYAAVILPGGNGTAANLCNFASAGAAMDVDRDLVTFLESMHAEGKPIGAICISPVILAKVFGRKGIQLTLGSTDNPAATAAQTWGARLQAADASECVVDRNLKVVTTPAYMCDAPLAAVAQGIRKLAAAVLSIA